MSEPKPKCRHCGKGGPKCRHCGKTESEHHPFEAARPAPARCVCPPGEWDPDIVIPKVCGWYDPGPRGHCRCCEHDRACHKHR